MSSISFSPSETKLVYVAEGKEPGDNDPNADPLSKFRFVPELGETYGGKKRPTIFLYDWSREVGQAVSPLAFAEVDAPHVLLAHPVFASDDKIIALGYEYSEDGRLLGIIYCPNRAASVWQLSLPGDLSSIGQEVVKCASSKLTSSGVACRSPRVFRHGGRSTLAFASNPVGGPHHSCSEVQVYEFEKSELRTVVEIVHDPEPGAFPGLYTPSLPVYPFLHPSDNSEPFLAVSSVWRSRTTVLLVSLTTGKVVDLTPDSDEHWSWTVLCTDGQSAVVCVRSALNRPPELVLGQVSADAHVSWRVLYTPALSDDRTSV